jgi:hypothetical protein
VGVTGLLGWLAVERSNMRPVLEVVVDGDDLETNELTGVADGVPMPGTQTRMQEPA